jgi:cytochrome c oxidase assembly factor CtaG
MTTHGSMLMPLTLLSAAIAIVYFYGRHKLQIHTGRSVPLWRSICFPFGLLLVWLATSSPLASLDGELLTAHMAQHLLLMSVAPFLILFSRPKMPLLYGLPVGFVRKVVGPVSRTRLVHYISSLWRRLVFCGVVSIGVLLLWHVPFVFNAALKSEPLHTVEHGSFLAVGFLFWAPLFPSHSVKESGTWSLVLYLFLATLPCDILSGFLVFCDRVVYSAYLTRQHFSDWSVLDDQQCAGALMWTCITIIYLVPAAALTIRLLSAKRTGSDDVFGPGVNTAGTARQ